MDQMLYAGRVPGAREKRKRDSRSERQVRFRSVDVVCAVGAEEAHLGYLP